MNKKVANMKGLKPVLGLFFIVSGIYFVVEARGSFKGVELDEKNSVLLGVFGIVWGGHIIYHYMRNRNN
jgi:hypothetical protein